MALVVNNNIPALQTYNALTATTNSLQKSIQKLSSGLRINSAADDAAGLAISEKMRAQIRGLDRAVSNSQDGISMIQTAEGALSETHSILQRMRELSVQAANDTLTQQDRGYIQLEIDQLREEITRIGNTTQFNKKKLLDGSAAALWSSDRLTTQAIINGGLRTVDQFGQKTSVEGNYVIDVNATPGKAQVQKSDIFTIKHKDVIMNVSVNDQAGINSVSVNNLPAGDYQVTLGELDTEYNIRFDSSESATTKYLADNLNLSITNEGATLGFTATVTGIDEVAGTVTLSLSPDDGTTTGTLVFNIADGTLVTSDFETEFAGTTLNAARFGNGNTPIDVSKLRADEDPITGVVGMSVDFVLQGAKGRLAITGANAAAYEDALGINGTISLTDSNGNSIENFAITATATAADTYTLTGTFTDLTGSAAVALPATLTGKTAADLVAGVDFTVSGETYTLKFSHFDVLTVATGAGVFTSAQLAADALDTTWWGNPTTSAATFGTLAVNPVPTAGAADLLAAVQAAGAEDYQVVFTAVGGGTTANAALYIGGTKVADATTVVDLATTTGPSFILGGSTITFAITAAGAITPAANDTYSVTGRFQAASTAGTADATYKNEDYLQVRDYKRGVLFETTDTTTDRYTISLRANTISDTDPTDPADDSILFDVIVTDSAGASVAGTPQQVTIARGANTFGLTINGETLNFNTRLLDSLDITQARAGDEFSVSTIKEAEQVGRYGTTAGILVDDINSRSNASVLMEVISVSAVNQSVTFKATANILNTDGSTTTRVANLTLTDNDLVLNSGDKDPLNLLGLDLTLSLNGTSATAFKAGDKLVYNVTPQAIADPVAPATPPTTLTTLQVEGTQNAIWDENWITTNPANNSVTLAGTPLFYSIEAAAVNGQDVHFKNFYVNEKDGTVYTGDIVLSLASDFSASIVNAEPGDVLASFTATYIGQVAQSDVKLRDLDKFWNSEGRFLLQDAQTLTITQGDGTKASVTLYATDTLGDVATKLNSAIAKQLGQQSVLNITDGTSDPAANSFVTFVDDEDEQEGTSEAVAGTFVIRSAIAGTNGTISFSGDEDIIKNLSLNQIQAAEENGFSVSVWDAHSGKSVASSVKITGNKLIGVLNENVDVVFDAMANINVEWNEPTRSFVLTKDTGSFQTTLHLADNTTVFQIGANEGEDMGINIGDMRANALGLNAVLVTDRESAARSITVIDNAIDKVSTQRAKLGAYQNRLEHTITNLTVAGENLTAAESRIRDTDMAKEMMNFTKLQIMLQAGTSMLAQANALPQNVLSLLR